MGDRSCNGVFALRYFEGGLIGDECLDLFSNANDNTWKYNWKGQNAGKEVGMTYHRADRVSTSAWVVESWSTPWGQRAWLAIRRRRQVSFPAVLLGSKLKKTAKSCKFHYSVSQTMKDHMMHLFGTTKVPVTLLEALRKPDGLGSCFSDGTDCNCVFVITCTDTSTLCVVDITCGMILEAPCMWPSARGKPFGTCLLQKRSSAALSHLPKSRQETQSTT